MSATSAIIIAVAIVAGCYILSWVQMSAWLKAIDKFIDKKTTEYLTKFKNTKNEEQKK
jgi:DNA-binding transcriptional regulator of glucitol operon